MRLLESIIRGFVNEEPMKAVKKDTNRVVVYTNKDNYDDAIKQGTHRPFNPATDKDLPMDGEPTGGDQEPSIDQFAQAAQDALAGAERGEEPETKSLSLGKEEEKMVTFVDGKLDKVVASRVDGGSDLVEKTKEKIRIVFSDGDDDTRREAAQWLVDEAGLETNTNKETARLNALGGIFRRILGRNNTTKELVRRVEALGVSLGGKSEKDTKKLARRALETAAKPDLGEPIPGDNPDVQDMFNIHPVLNRIPERQWGLYAVTDENGNVLPSSKNSKAYLSQSFGSPSLQRTIKTANAAVETGALPQEFATALEEHQTRLKQILDSQDIPSERAEALVLDSYNTLARQLHAADKDTAGAVMKQVAENALYESELARGDEVYLPAGGNFPGGDKIKFTSDGDGVLERVSLVSCKWGKKKRTYGFPANSKAVTQLHPDPDRRENLGQFLGEEGNTLVVSDRLIRGDSPEETQQKMQTFITSNLEDIGKVIPGADQAFTDDEKVKISTICQEYMSEIDRIKSELGDSGFSDPAYIQGFNDEVEKLQEQFGKRLGTIVTPEKAALIVGPNNASELSKKGRVVPEHFLAAVETAGSISTSDGFGLEHNKQYYDKGSPRFITERGTSNPDDYSITYRTKITAGRRGGGVQMSFSGDSKIGQQPQESAPPELRKLIRDIALWKLGKYGN
jgi:hypothetical protein